MSPGVGGPLRAARVILGRWKSSWRPQAPSPTSCDVAGAGSVEIREPRSMGALFTAMTTRFLVFIGKAWGFGCFKQRGFL